jgi:hypothetical protein
VTEQDDQEARLIQIAEVALGRTAAREMKWRMTDDPDAFAFSGSTTSLVVDHYPQSDVYELRVLNSRGIVVSTLRKDFDPFSDNQAHDSDIRSMLKHLHEVARKSALDVDGTLDAALAELNSLGDEPPF